MIALFPLFTGTAPMQLKLEQFVALTHAAADTQKALTHAKFLPLSRAVCFIPQAKAS